MIFQNTNQRRIESSDRKRTSITAFKKKDASNARLMAISKTGILRPSFRLILSLADGRENEGLARNLIPIDCSNKNPR